MLCDGQRGLTEGALSGGETMVKLIASHDRKRLQRLLISPNSVMLYAEVAYSDIYVVLVDSEWPAERDRYQPIHHENGKEKTLPPLDLGIWEVLKCLVAVQSHADG